MSARLVLVVEDNPADVRLTRRAFEKAGIELRLEEAGDGVVALERLLGPAAGPLPELLLLDLNLPRIDGHEVLRRLRAEPRTRRLPVIILTSSVEESDLARSYDAGANSYVRKPVRFEDFVAAARHLGIYWLQYNEPPPAGGTRP